MDSGPVQPIPKRCADPGSPPEDFSRMYEELRRLARVRLRHDAPGHTLQTTALVHEAYLRLGLDSVWESRAHFFGAAARAMRQVLIDHARRRRSIKRGGGARREALRDIAIRKDDDLVRAEILDGLVEELARLDARKAEIASFILFLDMTHEQIAEVLSISVRSVEREWRFTKAWFQSEYTRLAESSP